MNPMENLNFTPAPDQTSLVASFNSTSPYANSSPCDVFINHRGPDTKLSIASPLYSRLTTHRLRVFLDKEMEKGDFFASQIAGAIRTASVHIAIFSPRYAESEWCLNELVLMLESMESGRSTIIPVFYRVEVADLRWPMGKNRVYAEALSNLQKKKTVDSETQQEKPRYDSKIIENWRSALRKVSYIYGFELKTANDGDMSPFLDDIEQLVLQKVIRPALDMSRYSIGLDQKVKDFERLLQHQSGGTKVIGIVGLGGVGKTTLAKEIFNRYRSNYKGSCFLFDIRENSLITMQSDLLKDLTRSNEQIRSTPEGKGILRRYLSCKQALIILDNVDHSQQLDALLSPAKDVLHPSSLILVTSRDKQVLINKDIKESSIYKLECLNQQLSKQLFCLHVFNQPNPVAGFEELVKKISDACHGLPLSLTVLGEHMHGINDLTYWTAQLLKISKLLPDDIKNRLKISYDGLDIHQKQIFLDIACFFIGEDRETAIKIWDGSDWGGYQGIWTLHSRCLVEIDRNNCIRMHDHLRDLGRDIAKKEPPHRLWCPTDFHNLVDQSPVRGIHMVEQRSGQQFENPVELDSRFLGMRKLELLRAEGDCLKSIFSRVQSPHLIWLKWYGCPYSCLPPWIRRESLRVLEVEGSKMKTLWGERNFQAAVQLRELHIKAPLLKIPNSIGMLKYLEKIVLEHGDLKTFPKEFCHLQSLKHLELRNCSIESLPDSIGNIRRLQEMRISNCFRLTGLPDSIRLLNQLKLLEIRTTCVDYLALPPHVREMNNSIVSCMLALEDLELFDIKISKVSFHKDVCPNLQRLEIRQCETLVEVGALPTSLVKLKLEKCNALRKIGGCKSGKVEELPGFEKLICSDELIVNCSKSVEGLAQSTKLRVLDVENCCELEELPGLEHLTLLQDLNVRGSGKLQLLPSFEMLVSLETLNASACVKLKSIVGLAQLSKLKVLNVADCCDLEELPGLEHLTSLRDLNVSGMGKLQLLPSFEMLVSLETLDASACVKLKNIAGLAQLSKLEVLNVADCCDLEELPGLDRLTSLRYLYASRCRKLQSIEGLAQLTKLQMLDVEGCCELKEVPSFQRLTLLRELIASGCGKLQSIRGLAPLTELKVLNVEGCCELEGLEGVGCLASLRVLNTKHCRKLHLNAAVVQKSAVWKSWFREA